MSNRSPLPSPTSLPLLHQTGRPLDEGVLGEFIIATYLENRLTYSRAADAAEFWGGDAYALLRNPDQDESALVSLSTWDSVEDAQDFFGACISYVQAPGQESLDLTTSAEGLRRWDSESRSVYTSPCMT